jgi:hypothetical protein
MIAKSWNVLFCMAVFTAGACVLSAQDRRTWTSADGRTVEAAFVRLDGEIVEIKTDQGTFRLEMSKLSEADQEYARQQAAAAESRKPLKIEEREWSLPTGKIKARYVRLREGNVQLVAGKRVISHQIRFLEREDVAYLHALLESRGDLEKHKDDLSVQMLVSKERAERSREEMIRERQERFAKRVSTEETPDPAEPLPPTPEPAPASTVAATEPPPAETLQPAAEESPAATPSPSAPVVTAPSPIPPSAPPKTGIHSDDPWERDRAVMQASNQAAYYWMAGILGILVIFGPFLYAMQRMRN